MKRFIKAKADEEEKKKDVPEANKKRSAGEVREKLYGKGSK